MQTKITFSKIDLKKLKDIGINTIYLFGSRATGKETALSDYDFAILMKNSQTVKPDKSTSTLYQKIYEILSDYCPRTIQNDVIDIVFLQSGVSLELQAHVVKYGKIIFEENPELRAKYEEQVMIRMADMKPILDEMDAAIINR